MPKRRLLAVDEGGQSATRTPLVIDEYGNVSIEQTQGVGLCIELGAVNRSRSVRPFPTNPQLSQIPSIRPSLGGNFSQISKRMTNLNGVSEVGTALEVAQTSDGRQQLAKLTTKGQLIAGSDNVLSITITNNADVSRVVLLGDANTLINQARNVGPLADDVVVAGSTFGENTHPQLMLQTGNNPIELTGLHILVSDEKFFSQGKIRYIKAKPTGRTDEQTISTAGRINQNQQQTNVLYKPDFICTIDGYSALEIVIPAGVTVDLTSTITGSAEAYSMVDL